VFGGSQPPDALISTQESGGSLDIGAAGEAIDAPVVEAHRYIEQKRVASGEIEINDAGQAPLSNNTLSRKRSAWIGPLGSCL